MKHIYDFLKEILYHPDKKPEEYVVGYQHDDRIIKVKFIDITFEEENKFSFLIERDGEKVEIPFHRIRYVWRNEVPIWWRR